MKLHNEAVWIHQYRIDLIDSIEYIHVKKASLYIADNKPFMQLLEIAPVYIPFVSYISSASKHLSLHFYLLQNIIHPFFLSSNVFLFFYLS